MWPLSHTIISSQIFPGCCLLTPVFQTQWKRKVRHDREKEKQGLGVTLLYSILELFKSRAALQVVVE